MHSDRENLGPNEFEPFDLADIRLHFGQDADTADALDSFHTIETLFERVRLPNEMSDAFTTEPAKLDLPGFDEIQTLGSGGFGTVFLAHDRKLERDVAVKIPRADRWSTEDDKQRFLEEARLAAKLQHPGVVTLLELVEHDDRYHLVSEYIDGSTLQDVLEAGERTWQRSADLAKQLADALDHAHSNHVIHRDLKPTNILIDKGGNPRIADFGLAIRQDSDEPASHLAAGTVEYMSPEQLPNGDQSIDHRTDIWSLGVVLYELLTGKLPFAGSSREQLFDSIRNDEPPGPKSIDGRIPKRLDKICLRCLAKDPDERFQSAAELSTELRRLSKASRPVRTAVISLAMVATVAIAAFFVGGHYFGLGFFGNQLVSSMRIQHFRFNSDGKGTDLGKLGEDSSLIVENDSINVEVEFSRPAYFYLLELTSTGEIINHYSVVQGDEPVSKMSFPIESDVDLCLSDGPGSCMFAVVSSMSPLATFEQWRAANPSIDWQPNQHDGIWQYRNGRIHEMEAVNRSTPRRRKSPPEQIARACKQLDTDLNTEICAIAFPIISTADVK